MKVAIALNGKRVSSVFDVARHFALLSPEEGGGFARSDVSIDAQDGIETAEGVIELGVQVLICGAISWPVELTLNSAGLRVFSNIRGQIDDVYAAFIRNELERGAFSMPGCGGGGKSSI